MINYILFDLNRAITVAGDLPGAQRILRHLQHTVSLRRCENLAEIPRLIAEVNATLIQVPSYQHKKKEVSVEEQILLCNYIFFSVVRCGKVYCRIWNWILWYRNYLYCISMNFWRRTKGYIMILLHCWIIRGRLGRRRFIRLRCLSGWGISKRVASK